MRYTHFIVLFLILMLTSCSVQKKATEQRVPPVVRVGATFEDYIPLLEDAGYMVYSFDISGLQDTMYTIKVQVREFENGKEKNTSCHGYWNVSNMVMISDFSEPDQERILAEGLAEMPEKGICNVARRLTVCFLPGRSEAEGRLFVTVDSYGRECWILDLQPLASDAMSDRRYAYSSRPFVLDSFKENRFIPLVMYGSFWITCGGIARFCGERELPSDMSSSMLKDSPHYYIIGITVSKD